MTLSSPSAFAASTRASMPPRSSAERAVAASEPPLPPEPPSSPPPQAVRTRVAAASTVAVLRVGVDRTGPPRERWFGRTGPADGDRTAPPGGPEPVTVRGTVGDAPGQRPVNVALPG